MTIVEIVTATPEGLFLNEIAEAAGLPQPTAHRLVGSLLRAGLLEARGKGRKAYLAGPRLRRLLHGGTDRSQLQQMAEPVLRDLVAALGETAFLARLSGHEVVSVAMVAPERPWRGFVDPGHRFVAHAAASAKAILAFQPAEIVDRVLRPPLAALTPFTLVDAEAVQRDLAATQARGYAICDREISVDLLAYAVPVPLPGIGVIYSLAVTGPLQDMRRVSAEAMVAALDAGARRLAGMLARITARLG